MFPRLSTSVPPFMTSILINISMPNKCIYVNYLANGFRQRVTFNSVGAHLVALSVARPGGSLSVGVDATLPLSGKPSPPSRDRDFRKRHCRRRLLQRFRLDPDVLFACGFLFPVFPHP